jgi:phosphoglycerate-specific signal transduction histidine kinase
MFDLDAFVIAGHQKMIDHYRRLRDSASSETERQRCQQALDKETDALHLLLAKLSQNERRAA